MGRRNAIVLLALVCLVSGKPPRDPAVEYDRYKLFELVACADVVVAGTIVGLDGQYFTLEVERWIVGSPSERSLRIRRFQDWTCAGRWTPYAAGQRVAVFLRRAESGQSAMEILGGGGEGEMPLRGFDLVLRGYEVRDVPSSDHRVEDVDVRGSLVSLDELAAAVTMYRDIFVWEKGDHRDQVVRIKVRLSEDKVDLLRASSRLARHLVEETESSESWEVSRDPPEPRLGSLRRLSALELGCSGPKRLAPGRKPDRFGFELNSCFGNSCAFVGDVDGDGMEDLAVGASRDSYLGHFHGALWILFLSPAGDVVRKTEISEVSGGFRVPMNEFAELGTAVEALEDLDGDGVPDVAIGAPRWGQRGGIWILYLRRDGSVKSSVELGGIEPLHEILEPGFGIGSSIARLGDLDGDGEPELAIGQYPSFDFGWENGKAVLIVSPSLDGSVRWLRVLHDRKDGFVEGYSGFGCDLAGIGDLDGDEVPDLAIGDWMDDDGGNSRGAVWIVTLNRDGSLKRKQKISDWQGGFEGLLRDNASFGDALGAPGDLDRDQVPDLLVGDSRGFWTLFLNRDGTVRRHQDVSDRTGGFTDVGNFGRSIAVGTMSHPQGNLLIAVGGFLPERVKDEPVVWMLSLNRNGTITTW